MNVEQLKQLVLDRLGTLDDDAMALVEALLPVLADVWDDGYRNGYSIGATDDPNAKTNYQNPYRTDQVVASHETRDDT